MSKSQPQPPTPPPPPPPQKPPVKPSRRSTHDDPVVVDSGPSGDGRALMPRSLS
jgi:hypothetical protein